MPKMSPQEARELHQRLQADAQKMGLTVPQLVKLIASGQAPPEVMGGGAIIDPTIEGDPQTHLTDDGYRADIVDVRREPLSDFDVLQARREIAMRQAHGDDFAREAILQHDTLARQALQPGFGTNAPPSAATSILGGQQNVQTGTVGDACPTVAYWAGDTDAETRAVGVSFFMVPVDPGFGAFSIRPFGIVKFGTRGILAQAEVDIGTGCRFAVEGSQVVLLVGNDANDPALNASSLILSGMLSFAPVMRPTDITRTVYFDSAIPHGTTSSGIPIKPFAKSVNFFRTPNTGTVSLLFQSSGLQTLYSIDIAANSEPLTSIPIANDVTRIVVSNTDAAIDITRARLVFNLSF